MRLVSWWCVKRDYSRSARKNPCPAPHDPTAAPPATWRGSATGHKLDSVTGGRYTPGRHATGITLSAALREVRRLTTRPLRRRGLLAAMLVLVSGLAPTLVWAHAILEDSQPPAGGSVPAGKVMLRLRYNSRIDRGRSRLTLTRPDRSQVVLPID